ncbi:Translation initiation factor IF-3 like [Quillaja saponaria]|uniref:Translation initiation factor IF-3 like n=1 Tax=Quillaja saponaria TaxID=32244 RepID=A0AAD7LZH2_QUISA|nr:Translation initiation factor IF-3 like [Quillaja saponaria]
MASWCRVGRSKLKQLSIELHRCYIQLPHASSLNSTSHRKPPCVTELQYWGFHKRPTDIFNNARFFAAPVQAKPKKEEEDTSEPRLNDQIKAPFVRIVMDNGHSIVSRHEALERARKLKLDLVEKKADPPVCKIIDFHKEKYIKQVKEKERAKSKSDVTLRKGDHKEVRFSSKTELKDLKMKADMVKRFMERGYRVKCRASGNEDQDLKGLLSRLSEWIEDVAVVESGPLLGKKEAYMIVRHVKFGPSKKGGVKKLKDVGSVEPKPLTNAKSGFETEDNETSWSIVEGSGDYDDVLKFSDDIDSATSTDKQKNVSHQSLSNTDGSDLQRPAEAFDSMNAHKVPTANEPSTVTENRYKRTEPSNRFRPAFKSPTSTAPGARDLGRSGPQFVSQRRQPTDALKQAGTDTYGARNSKLPPRDTPKPDPSRPSSANSSTSGFGIFSSRR